MTDARERVRKRYEDRDAAAQRARLVRVGVRKLLEDAADALSESTEIEKRQFSISIRRQLTAFESELDYIRASGDMICPACMLNYFKHPSDPLLPFLNVLCDGRAVKL